MSQQLIALIAAATLTIITHTSPLHAYDGVVEKKTFTLPSYVTVGGKTIKGVKIGWESYGSLNTDKSNAILITHYFSGTSHAAGKYKVNGEAGYWDAIIGPGKPLDTDKYFILSSDTLVNLNAKNPNVITTGPATINPLTRKRYGRSFPIVAIRDFVNVQKALVESLGISKLHAVMGASMGALQAYEWASSYPGMVGNVIPVIGAGDADGWAIAWLHMWAAPILLDPNWNNGYYYGKAGPVAGLSAASTRSRRRLTPRGRRAWRRRTPTTSSTLSRPVNSLSRAAAISPRGSRRSRRQFSSLPATTILSSPPTL